MSEWRVRCAAEPWLPAADEVRNLAIAAASGALKGASGITDFISYCVEKAVTETLPPGWCVMVSQIADDEVVLTILRQVAP